jgi:hypothetical protein
MATLNFTAIGTAIGGPLGGAIGGLLGSQIDRAIVGGGRREGPRLKELGVSTSSYGSPIPRHHGRIRTPGSIVWSTDLVERKEIGGGGKGRPSVTSYSYSVSFAVALSSRPIADLGRIWADGNLLRGAAGDLKAGGELRLYTGHGDQPLDPLIASAEPMCPAFRGLAYCVFESLELADFGNRIPALTFEVIADDEPVTMDALVEPLPQPVTIARPLNRLQGFSYEGGPLSQALATLDQLYPLACDAGGESLTIGAADDLTAALSMLPEPAAAAQDGESFATATGEARRRQAEASEVPDALRYYDIARDYQPGMQRADGRARPGRSRVMEFPGALEAADARSLTNAAAARAGWARDTVAWRMAELDPDIAPGKIVRLPGRDGVWLVDAWEWRDNGIELELRRLPHGSARQPAADPGAVLSPPDLPAAPTALVAYELPWDGTGSAETRLPYAAVSSASAGWRGAALYLEQGTALVPIGPSGRRRSVIGTTATALPPSGGSLVDRRTSFEVTLISADFALDSTDLGGFASGANVALVGGEVLQFLDAELVGDARWRLTGLLRGRGGTEAASLQGVPAGAAFVLLDDAPIALDPAKVGEGESITIAALGLADPEPVYAPLQNAGIARRPLTPVHGRAMMRVGGGLRLEWCRRSRGSWLWLDGVDAPLNEEAEAYAVGIGDVDAPDLRWQTTAPLLELDAASWSSIRSAHAGKPVWVRQIGTAAASLPLLLMTIA